MEAALMASSSSSSSLAARASLLFQSPRNYGFPSRWSFSFAASRKNLQADRWNSRRLVIAGAKKKKSKVDSHSFVPTPDEATGPFPEAVLLKKEVVREDGRVLPEFADSDEEKLYEFLTLEMESHLNLERMRHYEVVYLIHEERIDEVDNVVSKVQEFVREKKGRIWRLNNWGLRRLAYKIRKATHANYILMNFELDAKFINDFKSILDKDERIIRHLVMKCDEAITKDCPPPPEFHTLGAEEEDADEDGDFDDEDGDFDDEEDDDEMELEMAGQGDFDDDANNNNIIFVDADDDNEGDDLGGEERLLKIEKVAR